jgi:hypothetical protein
MRFACLIITYTSAQQTKRLIDKLNNGDFDFYIHLDKKIDIKTHSVLLDMPNVFFVEKRVDIKWAGFTLCKAIFNGIKQIFASGKKYEFINLLSGQDYPIKSAAYISDFLKQHTGKQLIKCWDFETEWQEAVARIDRYHFPDIVFKGKYFMERMINLLYRRRRSPNGLRFYGTNSTFWTLTPECALYVVNYVEKNRAFYRMLKYSWGSDEFIFQTVIMNSPYKETVTYDNYRYSDWSAGGSRPKTLLTEDYKNIIISDGIIGRKFNIDVDANILDMIDEHNSIN